MIKIEEGNKVYGYVRVSTNKQETDVQKYEIEKWCEMNHIKIENWCDEKISGTKDVNERDINTLLTKAKSGDVIICTEVSRLGRSITIINDVMKTCVKKNIRLYTLKENYKLDNVDPVTKLILEIYAYAAETERNLISERTREGLAARKRAGIKLGRPCGSKSKMLKLDRCRDKLIMMIANGMPKTKIAKRLGVNTCTIYDYIKKVNLDSDVDEYIAMGCPKKWKKYN